MANDFFRFKQFEIRQQFAGMRVSTDACIQGALCAFYFSNLKGNENAFQVLDIGAGTGLLGLMLCQALPNAILTAIEMDEAAGKDIKYNFAQVTWKDRVRLLQQKIQDWKSEQTFDLIIVNPPFFNAHLLSATENRKQARHDLSLSKEVLSEVLNQYLKPDGIACVMYPATEWEAWQNIISDTALKTLAVYKIKPNTQKPINRCVGFYSKNQIHPLEQNELMIYDNEQKYTDEIKHLLKPYYLNL